MVFYSTFNNNSAISWRQVLLVEETRAPRENHRLAASHWQTWSHQIQRERMCWLQWKRGGLPWGGTIVPVTPGLTIGGGGNCTTHVICSNDQWTRNNSGLLKYGNESRWHYINLGITRGPQMWPLKIIIWVYLP